MSRSTGRTMKSSSLIKTTFIFIYGLIWPAELLSAKPIKRLPPQKRKKKIYLWRPFIALAGRELGDDSTGLLSGFEAWVTPEARCGSKMRPIHCRPPGGAQINFLITTQSASLSAILCSCFATPSTPATAINSSGSAHKAGNPLHESSGASHEHYSAQLIKYS